MNTLGLRRYSAFDRLMNWKQWLNRSAVSILGTNLEHKAEHNNCRMRGPESDSEASGPTVSPRKRVRAARTIHLLNRCSG